MFDPETSRAIQSVSGSQEYLRKNYTGDMVRDLPAWALQENSDPKLQEKIAGQSEASSALLVPLMTIAETAAILHLAPRTVRRMIKRGELEIVRIGPIDPRSP